MPDVVDQLFSIDDEAIVADYRNSQKQKTEQKRCEDYADTLWSSHAEGRHDWTSIQLNYVVNINYQPVGVGGHYGKRVEMNLELGQLFPRAGPDFESLVQNISLDTRQPPPHGTRRSPRAVQDAIG